MTEVRINDGGENSFIIWNINDRLLVSRRWPEKTETFPAALVAEAETLRILGERETPNIYSLQTTLVQGRYCLRVHANI